MRMNVPVNHSGRGILGSAALGVSACLAAQVPSAAPRAPDPIISADLISRADALKIVSGTLEACSLRGEKAAAFLTDADGNLRAALSQDGANPIGLASAKRKNDTVFRFRLSTRAVGQRAAADPAFAAEFGKDPRYYFSPGGLPLYRDSTFVGVLAVGGGHSIDEECALASLAQVPWVSTAPK